MGYATSVGPREAHVDSILHAAASLDEAVPDNLNEGHGSVVDYLVCHDKLSPIAPTLLVTTTGKGFKERHGTTLTLGEPKKLLEPQLQNVAKRPGHQTRQVPALLGAYSARPLALLVACITDTGMDELSTIDSIVHSLPPPFFAEILVRWTDARDNLGGWYYKELLTASEQASYERAAYGQPRLLGGSELRWLPDKVEPFIRR